ncbi:MAG: hypothetical protein Q4B25_03915, partial [Pseudomonadota bacterium]|nr:hypothetical protein [Pseudomonadota bacterium]
SGISPFGQKFIDDTTQARLNKESIFLLRGKPLKSFCRPVSEIFRKPDIFWPAISSHSNSGHIPAALFPSQNHHSSKIRLLFYKASVR